MRSDVRLFAVLAAATFAACGADGTGHDGSEDPASDSCQDEPEKSSPACHGALSIRIDTCPKAQLSLTPTRIAPGATATLAAEIHDAEGDETTLTWLADPDGQFDSSSPPAVTYRCESIGKKAITLIVSDGLCEVRKQGELVCVDATSFQAAGVDSLSY